MMHAYDLSRNDLDHGDSGLINVPMPTEAEIIAASDLLIADEIDEPDMAAVIEVLVDEMGDQFRDFLKTEPLVDIEAASRRDCEALLKQTNALLHTFTKHMTARVRQEAIAATDMVRSYK